jgi:hypothetical protein
LVKGPACPPAPSAGCSAGPKGKIIVKKHSSDSSKDKMIWKWQGGTLAPVDIPSPIVQTDLAVCLYDQSGDLTGAALPKGALWSATGSGNLKFKDPSGTTLGIQKINIKFSKPLISVKAKGSALNLPALPLSTPVTAQLVNLDNGLCWESTFPSFTASDGGKFKAKLP